LGAGSVDHNSEAVAFRGCCTSVLEAWALDRRRTAAFSLLLNARSKGRASSSGTFSPLLDLTRDGPATIDGASAAVATPSAEKERWGRGSLVIEISGIGLSISVFLSCCHIVGS
jgi:hypothetical protein